MHLQRLGHVVLKVRDVRRAEAFYAGRCRARVQLGSARQSRARISLRADCGVDPLLHLYS